ncbi:TetR/AcrR family transcriptional regulator [Cellulomonas fengjieae]|uniref:TetR family transcriptional regulator n=1 Tax=Cellulomonas fengjieae TaxID=2819978 RepID=A0ABS3SHW8_9CELL|nr:TetR family transcriptional regulator C-terminal domain-containing protein [Cellulomonas fengjieae]MBO3085348.1 TetR family transcriptional regulator [Cellulomonas fengjieae]MBO3101093.1 TetR family transcriptional regulator [Cellulomonas fengjieae]QVI66098.1 TetR family transcriptional regulator [Cellulomonas fengjieae]
MPKLVDADARRRDLAEATWRVIRRDGLENASVRNVAREAGLSAGSLRHMFATQAELLVFAMNQVVDRVEARLGALDPAGDPLDAAQRHLVELLPLDDERRQENEVWIAFTARSLVDPLLRECAARNHDLLLEGCRHWVAAIAGGRVDVDVEAQRLHALLDGLAVHAAIRPQVDSADRCREILLHHLTTLAG